MATDLKQIVENIVSFYDPADRTVVAIGAGGGQLIEFVRSARRVIAVDPDAAGMELLAARARECGLSEKFTFLNGDLLALRPHGDVAVFEFCLHEMPQPERALDHAGQLAADLLVIDHAPGSQWSWCAGEEDGVEACWTAVAGRQVRRRIDIEASQRFADFAALEAKMARQGPKSLERIGRYRGRGAIVIPMPYRMALL